MKQQRIYIDTSIVGGFFDNEQKEFDCLEMKREIQAKIYAEIKDMTAEERISYFRISPEQDPYKRYNKRELVSLETKNR